MVAEFLDLDRDGHLHFQTMEEKYGLLFCLLSTNMHRKDFIYAEAYKPDRGYMLLIYVIFMPYLQDLSLLRSRNFATMTT